MPVDEQRTLTLSPAPGGCVWARPDKDTRVWRHLMEGLARNPNPYVQQVLEAPADQPVRLSSVEGASLREVVGEGLPPVRVSHLLGHISAGLAHLHALGGAHGAVTPDSVRIHEDTAVVLVEDARVLDDARDEVTTARRGDATACVELLYFMLTGERYSPGPAGEPDIPRTDDGEPIQPSTIVPGVDVNLDAVALTVAALPYPTACRAIASQLGVVTAAPTNEQDEPADAYVIIEENDGICLPLPPTIKHPLATESSESQGDLPDVTGVLSLQQAQEQCEQATVDEANAEDAANRDEAEVVSSPAALPIVDPADDDIAPGRQPGTEGETETESGEPGDTEERPDDSVDVDATVDNDGDEQVESEDEDEPAESADGAAEVEEADGRPARALEPPPPVTPAPTAEPVLSEPEAVTSQIPLVELQGMNLDPRQPERPTPSSPVARDRRFQRFLVYYFGDAPDMSRYTGRDAHPVDPRQPIFRWVGLGLALVLILAVAVLAWPLPKVSPPVQPPSPSASASENPTAEETEAKPAPTIAEITVLDPQGDGNEHPELLAALSDGNAESQWFSRTYDNPAYGMKDGIGLLVRFAEESTLTGLTLHSGAEGGRVQLTTGTPEDPTASPVAEAGFAVGDVELNPGEAVTTDHVIVWVPELPTDPQTGGHRVVLSSVDVR